MTDSGDAPLAGRHIVVTGGAGARGQIVTARLAAAGAVCHVPARQAPPGTIQWPSGVAVVPGVNLTEEAEVDRFYAGLPLLWASVHLAGGFAMAGIADTSRDDFLGLFEQNAVTSFLCCRAAVRAMRQTGEGGRIVNVAARPGVDPRRGARMAAYATAKAAVVALTLALAEELKGEQILVNAIAPSTIDTPANRAAMPGVDAGKWLSPAAAAEAILSLVSPANMEISGAVLPLYARA
jgi:NAD(P)-dependent dehydrogenase (short-subunit alcohol dehydrogenase family)